MKTSTKNSSDRNWLVIYTRPKWEKRVNELLLTAGIQAYCPVRNEEHQWADRKKIVSVPLFNSYVFVKVNKHEELLVRQTLGVINFIYYQGSPARVRESEIEDIKRYLNEYPQLEIVSIKELSQGDKVKIKNGAFMDKTGDLLQIQGKTLLLQLEHLNCILITKVSVNNIELA
ncbi:MAG: antitermination protein NusG [Mucilaginibacter sp.]|nr:antitermination protein NusG [Mucilaginibacter sp.]